MVDHSPSGPSQEKPYAARAVVYTIAFLAFILGLVPSLFYVTIDGIRELTFWQDARLFWSGLQFLFGIAIFTIGLAAYLACSIWLMYFGKGPHVEFDAPRAFVATGPYRWVRNPVVICLFVTGIGEAIAMNSLGISIFIAAALPVAHMQVTRIEEPKLKARFGQSYIDYCNTVPRWLPRPPSDWGARRA